MVSTFHIVVSECRCHVIPFGSIWRSVVFYRSCPCEFSALCLMFVDLLRRYCIWSDRYGHIHSSRCFGMWYGVSLLCAFLRVCIMLARTRIIGVLCSHPVFLCVLFRDTMRCQVRDTMRCQVGGRHNEVSSERHNEVSIGTQCAVR